jgi:Cu2+-containing amine oxidase
MDGESEINETNIKAMNHNHHWGDSLPTYAKGNTIRVVYQNVHRSLSASENPHTNTLPDNLNDMEADVFMASETNINWKIAAFRDNFK